MNSCEPAVGAVVLAAGRSSRMGRPKASLDCGGGETFLGRWLRVLGAAGVDRIRVVLGDDAKQIRSEVAIPDRRVVVNPNPAQGMLSSFLIGLDSLPPDLPGVFLCPVDHPSVGQADLLALMRRLEPSRVVLPVHSGRRGHPVLFGRALFPELRAAPLDVGARAVVHAEPGRVVEVDAGPAVLLDVNTPEDYQRFRPSED